MKYFALDKGDALLIWDEVSPLLQKAIDRDKGRTSLESLKKQVSEDKATLWVSQDLSLAALTTVEKYGTGKTVCLVRVCGGEGLNVLKNACETVAQYAKNLGCDAMEIYGREGWLKALPGFEKDYIVMSRQL